MLTDAELLGQWRAGDMVAGRALFERHYASVLGFFRNKVGADSADLVQETFAACVAGRDRIREDSGVRAYLFGIAHNVLKSHLRARYRGELVLDFEAISVRDLAPGPSEIVVRKNEERLLLEALRSIAGESVVARIRKEPDEFIEKMVGGWPRRFDARRALSLGFRPDESFEQIIRIHLEDELGGTFVA